MGSPAIFSGNFTKFLTKNLKLSDPTQTEIITDTSVPTATSPNGSLALSTNGRAYVRKAGAWVQIQDPSDVTAAISAALSSYQSGGFYIANGNFQDTTVTGWATYSDLAGLIPVDGIGGTPAVTISNDGTSAVRGTRSLIFTKPGSNVQGQGFSYDFTIDTADKGKPLSISFDSVAGPLMVAGDIKVFVYDVTNSVLIYPAFQNVGTGTNSFAASFVATTSATYRLIFHVVTSATTGPYSVYFDNFVVGPQRVMQGAPITDWQAYTPIETNKGTAAYTGSWYWRRVGDSIEITATLLITAVGSAAGAYSISIPPGITLSSSAGQLTGQWTQRNTPTQSKNIILAASPTSFSIGTSGGSIYATDTLFITVTPGSEAILVFVRSKINEWSSSVTMYDRAVEEQCATSGTWDADDTALGSLVRGYAGGAITGALTAFRTKRVRFNNSIQPSDNIEVKFARGTGQVYTISAQFIDASGNRIVNSESSAQTLSTSAGVYWRPVAGSSTDIDVIFARYAALANDDSPAQDWINGWYWLVNKVASGAMVGGLISSQNIIGRTDGVSPSTGYIGEQIRAQVGATIVTTAVTTNLLSISLLSGIWDLDAVGYFNATTLTYFDFSVSPTSLTVGTLGDNYAGGTLPAGFSDINACISGYRVNVTTTQTYYLVITATGTGTVRARGRISATRRA